MRWSKDGVDRAGRDDARPAFDFGTDLPDVDRTHRSTFTLLQLLRYAARPAFSEVQLSLLGGGRRRALGAVNPNAAAATAEQREGEGVEARMSADASATNRGAP